MYVTRRNGIKFAGVARVPRLVPKVWLSKRSKLSEKVPDTVDSINNEAKCMRRTKEKLLGARKALKPLTQKVAVAVAEFAFVSLQRTSRQDVAGTGRA